MKNLLCILAVIFGFGLLVSERLDAQDGSVP
jgi:hypothetical protein